MLSCSSITLVICMYTLPDSLKLLCDELFCLLRLPRKPGSRRICH